MNHPTLRELTEAVHEIGPSPDHECADCARTVESLEAELALLRRADARRGPVPRTDAPERGAMKHAIVAIALVALAVGVILARRPAPRAERIPQPTPVRTVPAAPPEPFVPEESRNRPREADPESEAKAAELARVKRETQRVQEQLSEAARQLDEAKLAAVRMLLAQALDRKIETDIRGTGLDAVKIVSSEAGINVIVDGEAQRVLAGLTIGLAAGHTAGQVLDLVVLGAQGALRLERETGAVRIRAR
jgi:hypothetical protein